MNLKLLTITTLILSHQILCFNALAVELSIKNDISEYEENRILEIENALSVEAAKTKISFSLNPGEEKEITKGNVRSFVLSRAFTRHRIKYDVLCPKDSKGKHTINLEQIHENKIPGGCTLARTGHRSRVGGMNWEIIDKKAWAILEEERKGMKMRLSR